MPLEIVKITRQHTRGLLLSPFLKCYCLTSPHSFNHIWSYRTLIQAKLVSLES
jgi:hypothetical protein